MTGPQQHGLNPGDVVRVDRDASPQFRVFPIMFRVISVQDTPTYDGWAWIDGYELNEAGEATDKRSIFVQPEHLKRVVLPPRTAAPPARRNGRRVMPAKPLRRLPIPEPDRTGGDEQPAR